MLLLSILSEHWCQKQMLLLISEYSTNVESDAGADDSINGDYHGLEVDIM